ncbi:glycosyltransferase family 2 protein [Burkholderiaceae bacterium DAT-1]|nr:glycosyltransferase family 2 protein [Burkholderiaceae bacterium DAT-1]
MTPISLLIITRNAASQLQACIESARDIAAEIVVVDSGSEDGTIELAEQLGARVVSAPFMGFGPQKRLAVSLALHDWVLCLDADERLTPELREGIRTGVPGQYSAYILTRRNLFFGRYLRHGEAYPDPCLRLFDRRFANWSEDAVHEKVLTSHPVGRVAGDLLHDSAMNLGHYIDKQNRYTTTQAAMLFAAGKRASIAKMCLSPAARFIRFYFFRLGMLDGVAGLTHILIGSFFAFVKYAKLREHWRTESHT